MHELNVIKLPFYEWQLPEDLIQQCYHVVSELEYSDTFQNYYSLFRNIDLEPLVKFIDNGLNDIKESLYPNMPYVTLQSTQIWATRNGMIQKHHKHMHTNSILSGIIYLTDHENSGATRFYYRNPYLHHELNKLIVPHTFSNTRENTFDLYPKRGRMIIFPSNIEHETTPNKDKKFRYVISFNSFFSGTLGHIDAATAINISLKDPDPVYMGLTKRAF